jgi:transporter family-2 protein
MQKPLLLAVVAALISGVAIGMQSSLASAAGRVTGATLVTLLINFSGGVAAGLLLIVVRARQGGGAFSGIELPTTMILVVSGVLGLVIMGGIAYALPKIGVAAGLSTIIAGQMVVASLVDTLGLTGGEPIPLSWSRVAGLGLLALGTWAILPRE